MLHSPFFGVSSLDSGRLFWAAFFLARAIRNCTVSKSVNQRASKTPQMPRIRFPANRLHHSTVMPLSSSSLDRLDFRTAVLSDVAVFRRFGPQVSDVTPQIFAHLPTQVYQDPGPRRSGPRRAGPAQCQNSLSSTHSRPPPLIEQGNVFFVGHVTPLTAGMGFILAGSIRPVNMRFGSCPQTVVF